MNYKKKKKHLKCTKLNKLLLRNAVIKTHGNVLGECKYAVSHSNKLFFYTLLQVIFRKKIGKSSTINLYKDN